MIDQCCPAIIICDRYSVNCMWWRMRRTVNTLAEFRPTHFRRRIWLMAVAGGLDHRTVTCIITGLVDDAVSINPTFVVQPELGSGNGRSIALPRKTQCGGRARRTWVAESTCEPRQTTHSTHVICTTMGHKKNSVKKCLSLPEIKMTHLAPPPQDRCLGIKIRKRELTSIVCCFSTRKQYIHSRLES